MAASAAEPWSVESYPDETGFRARSAGLLERLAATPDIVTRSMARATCPDTGLVFTTWAVEGETISSPFTGRRFTQGPTGPNGPKQRDAEGRLAAFGGATLADALPPATARILLDHVDAPVSIEEVKAFLSIPGALRQQSPFVAANWARFLPLVGDQMSPEWHDAFRQTVASGRLANAGSEHERLMSLSTALLYSQWFPEGARVAGLTLSEMGTHAGDALRAYARRLLVTGNGDYQSIERYPRALQPLLNLHDFSPDADTRKLAQAALDVYIAVYALKTLNGVHTGAKRQGWNEGQVLGEMDTLLWLWTGGQPHYTTARVDRDRTPVSLHALTSSYRPNAALLALASKRVSLPFEAELAYPDPAMQTPGQHLETFYASTHFALGSVQLDHVHDSERQTTWSLNVRTPQGSLLLGGGQPRWLSPGGHSPYDQWIQKRGALLFVSGPTEAKPGETAPLVYVPGSLDATSVYSRQAAFSGPRTPVSSAPELQDLPTLEAFFSAAPASAASWLWVPRDATLHARNDRFIIETPEAWVLISPLQPGAFLIDPPDRRWLARSRLPAALQRLRDYKILVFPGETNGFALEAVERRNFPVIERLDRATRPRLNGLTASYRSLAGDDLTLRYQPSELRPSARINEQDIDWSTWAAGGHVASPPLTIKDGVFTLKTDDGAYSLDYTGEIPRWQPLVEEK